MSKVNKDYSKKESHVLSARVDNEVKAKNDALKKHYKLNQTDTTIKLINKEYEKLGLAPINSSAELEVL